MTPESQPPRTGSTDEVVPATAPPACALPESFSCPPAPPPESSLGHFQCPEKLAQGGMGVVYKAFDPRLNRPVALKMVRADLVVPGRLERFRQEATALASLQHPHIVQVHDWHEADGRPILVMEFVPGGSLEAKLRKGRLSATESARLVAVIAWAVHAAHEVGIVHRDLKPANVLMAPPVAGNAGTVAGGFPKVGDFGLAFLANADVVAREAPEPAPPNGASRLTATGNVVGTPGYMAPEQAGGDVRAVGPPADVWALGVILYQCLTGRLPFTGDLAQTLEAIRTAPAAPMLPEDQVPDKVKDLCFSCLAKDPARRPAITDLALRLDLAAQPDESPWRPAYTNKLEDIDTSQGPEPFHESGHSWRAGRWAGAKWLLLCGALLLGAGAIWWATRRPKNEPSPAPTTTAAFGVIEIGPRGVKMVAAEPLTTPDGADWIVLEAEEDDTIGLAAALGADGSLKPAAADALHRRLEEYAGLQMRIRHRIPAERVHVVAGAGLLGKTRAPEKVKEALNAIVREAMGCEVDFLPPGEEARLSYAACVRARGLTDCLLLDVGADDVVCGYADGQGQFVEASLGVGSRAFAAAGAAKLTDAALARLRDETIAPAVRKEAQWRPRLRTLERVALLGDAPQALVRYARPRERGTWVELSANDFDLYRDLLYSTENVKELKAVALKNLTPDFQARRWAEANLNEVNARLSPAELRAGAEALRALYRELKLEDRRRLMCFTRGDIAWHLGYALRMRRDD